MTLSSQSIRVSADCLTISFLTTPHLTTKPMTNQQTAGHCRETLDNTARLVNALDSPLAFGHSVKRLRLIETHISWVILTGDYAYKIKKPVNFGFLDFSTLDQRHHFCREELRLNRRFAPHIYLDVVEIRGPIDAPHLHGSGEVIDYAVKMAEFSQQCLLSGHAADGTLSSTMVDAIADRVTQLHVSGDVATADSEYGSAPCVRHWSEENLEHLAATVPDSQMPPGFVRLQAWYRDNAALLDQVEQRKADGHVRECHGDLHLGNMALIDNEVMPFDCIEFNPELRWIDTISEAAFVAMDLQARGYPGYGWRFINRYLEGSADYDGIRLLRYYIVYRALVRAKVEALQVATTPSRSASAFSTAFSYLDLATNWATRHSAGIIIMHGLSGSGKSTVAAQLVEALGAIRLRSDVIRKQIYNLGAEADSGSATDQGIYSADSTEKTYQRLQQLTEMITTAHFCVIVDATFLKEARRRPFLQTGLDCARIIVNCEAPQETLRKRISERIREHKSDPSEANLEVLERQIQTRQTITAEEREMAAIVNVGADGLGAEQIDQIRQLLDI
jgi:aminoglycoside phosphotransferase family enzyme/predicted kinase